MLNRASGIFSVAYCLDSYEDVHEQMVVIYHPGYPLTYSDHVTDQLSRQADQQLI